jgi:hypothetical protein
MSSRPALGSIQPPILWVEGALSPEVKRPGREVDHSSPTSAEVKKTWVYTSTPLYIFMGLCLLSQARDNITFLYITYKIALKSIHLSVNCTLKYLRNVFVNEFTNIVPNKILQVQCTIYNAVVPF